MTAVANANGAAANASVAICPLTARQRSEPPKQQKNNDDDQDGAEHSDAAVTVALAAEAATEAPAQENDEEQIELCRFFGRRWEQSLNLPSDVSRCRSVLDLAQVQSTFLTKMAADYDIEGRRLLQAHQELFANWMTTQPSSQNNQAASLKRNRRQSAGFASALCQLALFAGIPAAFWLHGDAEP